MLLVVAFKVPRAEHRVFYGAQENNTISKQYLKVLDWPDYVFVKGARPISHNWRDTDNKLCETPCYMPAVGALRGQRPALGTFESEAVVLELEDDPRRGLRGKKEEKATKSAERRR